jgi:hypothetical protein
MKYTMLTQNDIQKCIRTQMNLLHLKETPVLNVIQRTVGHKRNTCTELHSTQIGNKSV